MTLHYLPLEILEERYTRQMYHTCVHTMQSRSIPFKEYHGKVLVNETNPDEFLSPASRAHFSSTQTSAFVSALERGEVKDGDTVFVSDLWHIGMEGISYASQMKEIDIRVYAISYAGPFWPHDLLTLRFTSDWGKLQEIAWMYQCDGIFFGSDDHLETVVKGVSDIVGPSIARDINSKSIVTGLVWDNSWVKEKSNTYFGDRPIVLWPHRIAPTRNVQEFYKLANDLSSPYPEVRWVISSSRINSNVVVPPPLEFITVTKADYYSLVAQSCVVVSTGLQESFGYTVHEATALGTPVLCPRRSSYPETILTETNLYDTYDELCDKTKSAIHNELPIANLLRRRYFNQMLDTMGYS